MGDDMRRMGFYIFDTQFLPLGFIITPRHRKINDLFWIAHDKRTGEQRPIHIAFNIDLSHLNIQLDDLTFAQKESCLKNASLSRRQSTITAASSVNPPAKISFSSSTLCFFVVIYFVQRVAFG